MTRRCAALLEQSMSNPPVSVSVTLLVDQDRYYVSARINGRDHELGRYDDINEAAGRMNAWIAGRGYVWATDTAQRVDEAKRRDARILTLDAVRATDTDS